MTVKVSWLGYIRQFGVLNKGSQVIRASFRTAQLAEEWANENGYEVEP